MRTIAVTCPYGAIFPDMTEEEVTTYQENIENGELSDDDKNYLVDRLVASWRALFVVGTPSLDPSHSKHQPLDTRCGFVSISPTSH